MFAPPLSLCFFEPHRPPSGPSTHPLMPSRQQQTVAKRGDDRLARARAFRNPPTGAKRAGKEKKLATSPRAVLIFFESLGLVAPPRVLLGPFRPLDFRCSSFRRPYEAPRGARGTYGRAKAQRIDWNESQEAKYCRVPGPGAWCRFLKNGHNQKAFDPRKSPQNMTPDPVTILTATASSKKCSGGVWGRPDWL